MTQPTHVCGMIKPLEWVAGDFCGQPCFYADSEFGVWMVVAYSGLVGRWAYDDPCGNNSDYAWDNAEAAKAAAQADYEARIAAQIQPVASSEAGELISRDTVITTIDKWLDDPSTETIFDAIRALPAARAEITSLDHPAIDAYWEAKRNTVVTRDINGWRRSVLNGLNAALRALTEAGE